MKWGDQILNGEVHLYGEDGGMVTLTAKNFALPKDWPVQVLSALANRDRDDVLARVRAIIDALGPNHTVDDAAVALNNIHRIVP